MSEKSPVSAESQVAKAQKLIEKVYDLWPSGVKIEGDPAMLEQCGTMNRDLTFVIGMMEMCLNTPSAMSGQVRATVTAYAQHAEKLLRSGDDSK